MARVTVEDCLARVPNRFALTVLASRRARMLGEGRGQAMIECANKEGVTALREVADDRVRFDENVKEIMVDFIAESRRQLRLTTGERTFLEAASLRAMEEDDELDAVDKEEDVEELPADPEAISFKAKSQTEEDAAVDVETDDEAPEGAEAPDAGELAADLGPKADSPEIDDDDDDE